MMSVDAGIPEGFLPNLDKIQKPNVEGSKIVEFFKNKKIFVSGATGFLGKLLVEKLLRACEDIDTIYILVRPKKNEDELTRIDKLYDDNVFCVLKQLQPKFRHKISIIKGDISLPGLGIGLSEWKFLSENINIIFHIAATVKFDEKIKNAVAINVQGTKDMLTLAKDCKHLESFVHISTAFAFVNGNREIDETIYEVPYTADQLIELTQTKSETWLDDNTECILANWPNTYAFTKAIAENTVQEYGSGLPVCIFRPAIVIATYKEPIQSWIDNFYGATGILIGSGTGLLKSIHCNGEKLAEIVPADYVINGMITAAYTTAVEKKEDIPIYNYVSSPENPLTWDELMSSCARNGVHYPTIHCIWYFCLTLNKYKFIHLIYAFFLHTIPAIIMDLSMIIIGQKPMMRKVYSKVEKFSTIIAYFCTQHWKFYNRNTQDLWNRLSEADQRLFPFSMRTLDWDEFNKTHLIGLRLYVLKDDLSTLPEARRKWMRFYILHITFKCIIYFILFKLAYHILYFLYNSLF